MAFGSLPSVLGSGGGTAYSLIGGTGLFADGTAAAPSISFASDTDTGFYRHSGNVVGLSIGGVDQFRWGGTVMQGGAGLGGYISLPATGEVSLVAGGTAKNITLTPSGTGTVDIFSSNDASFGNVLRVLTPALSSGNSALILLGKAGAANQSAFINYFYSSTAALGRLDFGHNGTTGQVSLLQTGRFLIGTGGVDSGALLQVGNDSSVISGGMVFGTSTFFYRKGDGILGIGHATLPQLYFTDTSGNTLAFVLGSTNLLRLGGNGASGQTRIDSGGAQAVIFDTSQRTILSGALRLNNAYVAGAVVGTGYITIQDSTGTTYRVPVLV